jgi:hypothetical protein
VGLVAALAPAIGRAQTNIDQGKSASQIFSNACAECHKSAGALRKGKSAAAVAEFLREHYTTGPQQAASLAAYVVGGRDSVASPAPGQKPAAERAQKPRKPEEGATANTKRRPGEADAKPKEEAAPSGIPSFMNPIVRPEPPRPTTATRNRRKDKEQATPTPEPAQEPAAVARVPAAPVTEPTRPDVTMPEAAPSAAPPPAPTAAAPMETPSGEPGEPASRDNIPD